ncbi:helix-turn-helix domain-containing protein [uncultured Roseobacter sp.]|uniref:helix-turn-helix domain-containing protein n=1 Tax=uncultured Roseobacter sp. TaxID=114847 RepID=UPI002606AB4B|nr:helix-turn-helix domain-containing protein [uncultured Roseobacter sp.]
MTKGRPKRLKLEERIALARRYHAGDTPKVLAEAYGVSRRHVTRIAKEEKGEGQDVRDPSVTVSFRTAQSDLSAFDAEWQGLGFATRSQALQAMVRARCGVLSLMQRDLQAFAETVQRAQNLSDAARVLAKAVQRGQLHLAMADRQLMSDLLELAQGTHRDLASLKVAAHRRRSEGWAPTIAGAKTEGGEVPTNV